MTAQYVSGDLMLESRDFVSDRLNRVEGSATLKYSNRAKEMKAQGENVIEFTLGEPDFPTPKNICDAAAEAMYAGETHYSAGPGLADLREAIAEKLQKDNAIDAEASSIILTPGAKQALFMLMQSTINDGDEVILFDPCWVSYDACVRMAGGIPVYVPTDPTDGFRPVNPESYITPKTKMIVFNSPCNPTGAVYDESVLREIADVAVDHNLLVLADEIYEKIIYGKKHISIGSLDGMAERTVTLNGFSKAYAMTGWRLGYMHIPEPSVFKALSKIQSHSVGNVTTFIQYGAIEALRGPQDDLAAMTKEFKERRNILIDGLNKIGFRCPMPDGAFYAFPDVSEFGNGEEVTTKLLNEAKVAVVPGFGFGKSGENYVRFSYATSVDKIREALERMEKIF